MMFRSTVITLTLCLSAVTAQAALLGRAALTPGDTGYQAYYDTNQNITWLADTASAPESGNPPSSFMTWGAAMGWASGINIAGVSGWRLPEMDIYHDGTHEGGTAAGQNGTTDSEFDRLLKNEGIYCDTGRCSGPFRNLTGADYWSSTTYERLPKDAWTFSFYYGGTNRYENKLLNSAIAWAVHDGDPFSVVPVPAAAYLFGSALGLMGVVRRNNV